jgi:hypothetical protein
VLVVVAPLSTETLAKFALGLASNPWQHQYFEHGWFYDLEEAFASPVAEKYGSHVVNKPVNLLLLRLCDEHPSCIYQKITHQHT